MDLDNDSGLATGSSERPRSFDDWLSALAETAAFYTRLPFGRATRRWSPAAALPVLPVIGLGIGLAAGLAFAVAQGLGAAPLLAGVIALAVSAVLTGALHEDGLADSADGFGPSGIDAERRLEIMRDSSIGVFGACALILSFGMRAAALAELGAGAGLLALAAAHVLSRAAMAWPMMALAPARSDGLGAAQGRPGDGDVWLTLAIGGALAFLLLIGRITGAAILAPIIAVALAIGCAAIMRRRVGGYTGDTLGATQQAVEIGVLVVCALCVEAWR
jgi:adenosylcobinamide-GDP ribazoletransferase